ncbi:MAG: glycosyltransferase [Candidatus Thorarchaeota archaeon]
MANPTSISVVTPIHKANHKLLQIRRALSKANEPIQLVVVLNNPELVNQIGPQSTNELVVVSYRKGRGFALLEGIAKVTGAITVLLHSDTIPPPGWDQAILTALKDSQVVGGGFTLTYETSHPYLDMVSWVSNQWVRVTGELYGDRAMFIRSHILRRCLPVLEVPIFEDLRLTHCMRKHGRVVLLDKTVETSAEGYRKHGLLGYIGKIWLCRVWYALGGSPFKIYKVYYSSTKSDWDADNRI